MDRTPVDSSVIEALGYDGSENLLEVKFRSGRVYQYFMVPNAEYERLRAAESIGAHFNREIRTRYPFREITSENGRSSTNNLR
ncbi:MAG TPA: KTSC domain-containing protein [Thermoanaerobaculia bacterium]